MVLKEVKGVCEVESTEVEWTDEVVWWEEKALDDGVSKTTPSLQ